MSLGCGAYAGNITSDNITPFHLINIKRLAYELPRDRRPAASASPAVPAPSVGGDLSKQVAAFVAEKVGRPSSVPAPAAAPAASPKAPAAPAPLPRPTVDFVAEDDVRRAINEGRTITLRRGAIVTPAAKDLADGKNVLVEER
jgi:acetaldehyde dehydrogenase (acetylating)